MNSLSNIKIDFDITQLNPYLDNIQRHDIKFRFGRKNKNSEAIIWEGNGINEIGRRADSNEIVVRVDARYFRPAEVDQLLGDSSKAKNKLGWLPKTTLEELIDEMITKDKEEAQKKSYLRDQGFNVSDTIESPPSVF